MGGWTMVGWVVDGWVVEMSVLKGLLTLCDFSYFFHSVHRRVTACAAQLTNQ